MNEELKKNKTVLFVSHKKAQCGVYEFGDKLIAVLKHSKKFQFIKVECSSMNELQDAIDSNAPDVIIYNYYHAVLPWIAEKKGRKLFVNKISKIALPQIGIIHEITQQVADSATVYRNKYFIGGPSRLGNSLFDFYIAPDPTLLLQNPYVYKTGRLVPKYQNDHALPAKTTIGSFGFGTPKKGFENIVRLVEKEFDEAIIRFNIPSADFGDKDGRNAKAIEANCRSLITKPGISLAVTHDFLEDRAMLDFIAQHTINVFLYEDTGNRGLSSTVDNAMAVKRPVAISGNKMFRHVLDCSPSICVANNSLKQIIANGFAPLQQHYDDWTEENLLWEYERILGSVLKRPIGARPPKMGIIRTLRSKLNRIFSLPDKSFTWLRNSERANEDDMTIDPSLQYVPVQIPPQTSLNRILDNDARKLYAPAIELIKKAAPITISKKIAEANVQQAFVFDTVFRFLPNYPNAKLLCVGSYEDTASMTLLKMGYTVEEIDPMINYYLQEYFTKPTTIPQSYDIIFSTSVIEHDPDDESFVQCIAGLLAPGGIAVITCDYKEDWKPGDPKPEVDARFYIQEDLKTRLLSFMPGCSLVDEPHWDCPHPDFNYLGKYQYSFATFVIKKNK